MPRNNDSRASLTPFERRWAEVVLGWMTSPEELWHWSAQDGFPLTDVSVFDAWHSDPEVAPYVLRIEDEIVAYGEMWLDASDGTAELGRLVVAPACRRQGFARQLAERLASLADQAGYRQVWVRVLPTNGAAIRCYESIGFLRASAAQEAALNAAQRFPFVWMVRFPSEQSSH
jgi:ribosomal protein S18 acetylase RimI-like enzyme